MRKSKLNKINRRKQNEFLKANGRTPAQIQRIIAKKNKKKGQIMFLFLSDWLDVALVTSTLFLIISNFVLIFICKSLIKDNRHTDNQMKYWQQQALSEKHRDEEN